MRRRMPEGPILSEDGRCRESEAEEVLAALHELLGRVSSPPLRECLEAACADIALLTSGRETDEVGAG